MVQRTDAAGELYTVSQTLMSMLQLTQTAESMQLSMTLDLCQIIYHIKYSPFSFSSFSLFSRKALTAAD